MFGGLLTHMLLAAGEVQPFGYVPELLESTPRLASPLGRLFIAAYFAKFSTSVVAGPMELPLVS